MMFREEQPKPDIPQPLSAGIIIERNTIMEGLAPARDFVPFFIHVGNTGLTVVPTYYEGRKTPVMVSHYTPEGAEESFPEDATKYAQIYQYALYHLLSWWENPDNLAQVGLAGANRLSGETNETFNGFLTKLLGSDINVVTRINSGNKGREYEHDLYLDRLSQNAIIRQKLARAAEECAKMGYTMDPQKHKRQPDSQNPLEPNH